MKFWPRLINSVLVGLVVFIVPAVGSATTEEDICGPGGAGEAVAEEYVSKPEGGYSLEQPIGGKASVPWC
ncbi:MAG: hypothetical protein HYV33_00945 [Candidatus Kerfeldbacteria bacterium]|nr:hypothetical protein [Candidatus Kerfeldbacteria bacterium]